MPCDLQDLLGCNKQRNISIIFLNGYPFQLGFLRRDKSGTTTLAILNRSQPGGDENKPVNLGMLTGKLTQGTGTLPGFREDKRNKAIPGKAATHRCLLHSYMLGVMAEWLRI